MSLEELRRKRLNFVKASEENGFLEKIRSLLSDLYPDNAHFIYELLQNAEDAKATNVRFVLERDSVRFEHDGCRLFSFEDVEAITSLGDSHKRDDPTSIGKFGVGFKAVFAYSSTPEIKSGSYHFRIRDLVVPDTADLPSDGLDEKETRFYFPFDDKPEKSKKKACAEIERTLRALDDGTLLFLRNIRKIEYTLPDSSHGFLERNETGENRIGILVQQPGCKAPIANTFLRFGKEVFVHDDGGSLKSWRIAIAYGLERAQGQEWKIRLLDRGRTCIFFPAVKEQSNLKFHLHAPFASTVARDSVRDCEANDQLRDHLSELIAESMTTIREQKMLTVDSLAILPNDQDNLLPFYEPIRDRLDKEFHDKELVPMESGGYASASDVFKGEGDEKLSRLISDSDLATILGEDHTPPLWIVLPEQNPRALDFLSMLDIPSWSTENLVEILTEQFERVANWLESKSDVWHQHLYALLGEFLGNRPRSEDLKYRWREDMDGRLRKDLLSTTPIIRLSNGAYKSGSECYFPSDGVEHDEKFPRVAKGVYSSGEDKTQQQNARKFLLETGVRNLDEVHRVEAVLKDRYSDEDADFEDTEQYLKDLKRFMPLIDKDPQRSGVFRNYRIFWTEDSKWRTPYETFADSPGIETGLRSYFEAVEDDAARKWALDSYYDDCSVGAKKLREFAEAVGVQTKLTALKQEIPRSHPEWRELTHIPGSRRSPYETDEDYDIKEFSILLKEPSVDKAKLIWRTMRSSPDDCLRARYSPNESHPIRCGASSLVHSMRISRWIPQDNQQDLDFVAPCDARAELLPMEGFPYESGQKWIEAIEFGNTAKNSSEELNRKAAAAKDLGFDSAEQFEEITTLMARDPEGFERWRKSAQDLDNSKPSFPIRSSKNPERRSERFAVEYQNAPAKEYETRDRSVRTSREENDRFTFLRNQYTNEDDQMICQVCEKEMPFKKRNGEYYFEAVEALSGDYFSKEHEAQYIAFCPTCAARYQEFVKKDDSAMQSLFDVMKGAIGSEISIKLGDWDTSIRFVETHWLEMKAILKSVE